MQINDVHFVSPNIQKAALLFPLTLSDKINIFEDRVLGWQLNVAWELYYGPHAGPAPVQPLIKHNGFAVLYILLSYFEMIPKYEKGDLSEDSGKWFKEGITAVFPEFKGHAAETSILSGMWKGARNGLYHSAMTKSRVFVSGEAAGIDYDGVKKRLTINPGVVATRAIAHFEDYVTRLRDASNGVLRENFRKKFDREILPQLK
jgi:hypothetical protein